MTIQPTSGDLLKQVDVDAIVNTVNCVGVMGKGIALQFKKQWPENYTFYRRACKNNRVQLGQMLVFDSGLYAKPHYIINFPTKNHWREKSKLADIANGLEDLVSQIRTLGIKSIAVPPLGCGNGGLLWQNARPLIENAFAALPDVEVRLFAPSNASFNTTVNPITTRPRMTAGRAALLKAIDLYGELNYGLSKIEVQKLGYFLQAAGQPLGLQFHKHLYGPYSDQLRHALSRMDGHFINGLGDDNVDAEITPDPNSIAEADDYIAKSGDAALHERLERIERLIDGFQSPYGMELLATVHWVGNHGAKSADEALTFIGKWSDRKRALMQPFHIQSAWDRLSSEGWLS